MKIIYLRDVHKLLIAKQKEVRAKLPLSDEEDAWMRGYLTCINEILPYTEEVNILE